MSDGEGCAAFWVSRPCLLVAMGASWSATVAPSYPISPSRSEPPIEFLAFHLARQCFQPCMVELLLPFRLIRRSICGRPPLLQV